MHKNLDHAEKIHSLIMIIKNLCEENNIYKEVVVDDFNHLMMQPTSKNLAYQWAHAHQKIYYLYAINIINSEEYNLLRDKLIKKFCPEEEK